jgi:cyclic pyranopterin phosphate synthase
MSKLTHLDEAGHAHMVDVSGKSDTDRMATATAIVQLTPAAMAILLEGNLKKGDALAVARIAGIMAAKKTSELIPLCHPLPITKVTVDLEPDRATHRVLITATVKTRGQTGVEMEVDSCTPA